MKFRMVHFWSQPVLCAVNLLYFNLIIDSSPVCEGNGKGISESAILDNQEARAYYEQYRSWRGSPRKRAKPLTVALPASPGVIKPGWNEQRMRQRDLRIGEEALVERLIAAERTLAEQQERWFGQQDETLTWRLRAETAEAQLQKFKEKPGK